MAKEKSKAGRDERGPPWTLVLVDSSRTQP